LGPVTSPLTGKPMKINSIKPNAQNRVPPAAVPATPTLSAPRNVLTTNPQPVANPTPASAPTLSAEASASNTRTAQALVKTTDHSAIKPHIQDALKTGGAKAQLEVQDLTQQMDKLSPGAGTKLAKDVGLNASNNITINGVPDGASVSVGTDNGGEKNSDAALAFWDDVAGHETQGKPYGGYNTVNGNPKVKKDFALGKYQMRTAALKDTGYLDKHGNWTGRDGIKSYQDFLNNPSIQRKSINEYGGVLGKELSKNGSTKYIGQKIDGIKAGIKITRSNLIAAAHRQGAGNVNKYLKYMKSHNWKSDFSDVREKEADMYKSVETRLRLYQHKVLP